ncbi:MAG: methionyl-tRNA formyltransferase [Burkholderiaceae bacterium]|nr:methionyl-tRNA formyltransferase [Burkholderiaceae bacterium]
MKIVFAGTPDFAAAALDAIVSAAPSAGWSVPLVLTQPDRPAKRGVKLQASPVKQRALAHGLEVDTPSSLRKGDAARMAQARLESVAPDVLVVAAYGLILPPEVLAIPRGVRAGWLPKLSALNIHASLLPRWRGAAPIARAIEAGDAETGITIMQMDAGLDTGPMLAAEKVAITSDDTADALTSKLAQIGARLIVEALFNIDRLAATPQPEGATYATKLNKSEAWLDWSSSAAQLARKVRAFNPFPIASSLLNGTTVRLWRALASGDRVADEAEIGVVKSADASGLRVACGAGELLITELQRAGGKRVTTRDFLSGFAVQVGDRFVSPHAVATE